MIKDIQDDGGHHGIDKFVCLLNADGTTLLFVSGADVSRAKYHEQQLNMTISKSLVLRPLIHLTEKLMQYHTMILDYIMSL